MALVKFYRGLKEKYSSVLYGDGIYFATDSGEILMNDTAYGYNAEDHREVSAVDYTAPDTITITYTNGESDTVTLQAAAAGDSAEESIAGIISADDIYNLAKVQTDLAQETEDREASDTTLQENIDNTNAALTSEITRATTAETNILASITSMDVTDSAVAGQYVTAVTQANGVISVSRSAIVLDYNSGTQTLQLKNGDGIEFGGINASAFIKDGMIDRASFDSETSKISLVFNTDSGKDTIEIDVSSLVDTYTNSDGSLVIDSYNINHSNTITGGTTASTETGTLDYNGSFVVPTVTYDSNGHVTETGSVTITLPAQVTLAELNGIDTITVTGDQYLTLVATKTNTSVAITGAVNISNDYYNKTEINSKETSLQDEMDATQKGAGLNDDGSYVADTGDSLLSSATSLANADTLLSAAITAEATRAAEAEVALTTQVGELSESLSEEATAREEADTVLQAALASAVTAGTTAITEAINALDYGDSSTAGSFVTSVSETDGIISVTRGAVTSSDSTMVVSNNSDGGINLAANIDGSTIVKNTNGILSVASSALTQYVGENAIVISGADSSNNKTVSLGIASTDVLSQNASGLVVTLGLSWDSASKKISLTGVNGAEIASMDASDFVIDGMLQDASYNSTTQVMTLTVNTGTTTKTIDVDLSSLVDVYANSDGSLSISGHVINHANSITAGTTMSTAEGTLTHGGSFTMPVVSYDSSGHITSTSSVTLTLPSETTLSKGTEATATATLEHGGTFGAYTSVAVSDHTITPTVTTFTLPGETALSKGTEATAATTLEHGGTFTAYTAFTVTNHTITPTLTTFTMPTQATLADLGGIAMVTASGDDNLTLTATSSGTAVAISGTVDLSGYYTADEVNVLVDGTQDAQADDWEELD